MIKKIFYILYFYNFYNFYNFLVNYYKEEEIPEEIRNQEIKIDIELFILFQKDTLMSYFYTLLSIVCIIIFLAIILFILSFPSDQLFRIDFFRVLSEKIINILEKILENYYNDPEYNRLPKILHVFIKTILLPIISYLVIMSKIKENSLYKSWYIYMLILFFYIFFVTKGWIDGISDLISTGIKFIDILKIFNIFGETLPNNFFMGIRVIISTFIWDNFLLIVSYYTLKGYYHLRPMEYKEKRDYINNLKNINISPIQLLDNDLDNNLIFTKNN
jgi:hypothetical protein